MKLTPSLWLIILALALLVATICRADHLAPVWSVWQTQTVRPRRARNPKRNALRQRRRQAYWQRRQPVRAAPARRRPRVSRPALPPLLQMSSVPRAAGRRDRPKPLPAVALGADDPLAELRNRRGWIDQIPDRQLWETLRQVRWPDGARCPWCGEHDPRYLKCLDPDYRGGLGRWRCQVCAQAGDPGEGGTFTPLSGTVFDGQQVSIRTLWLIVEAFAVGRASVETAGEARVNRHTTDRWFRLLRAALYLKRTTDDWALTPDEVGEFDEVYITAGLKGHAGGLDLVEREPRRRGLKQRGRGTWDSDRVPVLGLVCRGGQVRLLVLRNVQTETIRPWVHQMVRRGATIYTDSYSIYHFLERDGYQHATVNHGAGEYALDLDGDGRNEVHCNTMECTWSWLRPMIRTFRGISKVYLPLYVAQFEFLFNHRRHNRWNRTLDVLQCAFQVPAPQAAHLLEQVDQAEFAAVCPIAG